MSPAAELSPVLTLEGLLSSVGSRPDPGKLIEHFVPPPRFEGKDFSSYQPRHATQTRAAARLRGLAGELAATAMPTRPGLLRFFGRRGMSRAQRPKGRGIYLDGGFGVGKTHLLSALWNAGPAPKFYLSFDELMYFIGLLGTQAAADAFRGARLIAIDEWELDDPGNLKMALAFIRAAIEDGACIAVTSNTLPLDLGAGRFSQKDFKAEVEELASVFEVIRVEGEDYRHRHYAGASAVGGGADGAADPPADGRLRTTFRELMTGLGTVHPSRFREVVAPVRTIALDGIDPLAGLADALRWVHFIDSVYVNRTQLRTEREVRLDQLFADEAVRGPFGKKLLRCVSRLEELLSEDGAGETAEEA
jgi:cell division protein ZapE